MEKQKKDKKKKKQEREEKQKQEIEKVQKEIESLIANMNELLGDDESVKMVEFKIPTKKEKILSFFIKVLVSLIILFSISGFINWLYYDAFVFVVAFFIIIIFVESIVDWIISFFFGKYIIYSFGALKLLAPLTAFIVAKFVFPIVIVKSFWWMALIFVLYCVIRKVFMDLIKKIFINKTPKIKKR